MELLEWLLALYWAVMFVLFCLGEYKPTKFTVGCLILFAILLFSGLATKRQAER